MDSLIEAAEKNFEANTPLNSQSRLPMKVLKMSLFKRLLPRQNNETQSQALTAHIRNVVNEVKDTSSSEYENVFANLLSVFYYENAICPTDDTHLLIDLISIALKMKMNGDVNKLIRIGVNSEFIKSELIADEEERETRSRFFETCSLAYNLTRNMEKALELLRDVEQRTDMNFSICLFNNVIESCMKCKHEQVAENLLEEYSENVDEEIRHNYQIVCTMITGYSKLGKVDKAFEIYTMMVQKKIEQSNLANTLSDETHFLNTATLNSFLECLVKKNYIKDAEVIFHYHLKTSGIVDLNCVSILIRGFCKSKQLGKALELCEILPEVNIEPTQQFFTSFLEACV